MFVSVLVAAAQLLSAVVASNVCQDSSSLLQAASVDTSIIVPAIGPNRIPCIIHQIWNGSLDDMPVDMAGYVKSWKTKNPGCEHRLWKDADIDVLVMSKVKDSIAPIWSALSPTERADIFRYLVLYDQGGYFAELTVSCEKPIADYQVPNDAQMLVGYEFGHRWSEVQRLEVNFARTEQFANYFLASAPQNPVLKRALEMVRERFSWKIQSNDLTGAAALSDAVHEFLEVSTPDAVAKENTVRKNPPSVHFLSYPSEHLYGEGEWKVWLLAAGRINSAPQVAADDPSEGAELLVSRHN